MTSGQRSVERGASRGAWARRQAAVDAQRSRWHDEHEAEVRAEQETRAADIAAGRRPTPRNIWRALTSSRTLTSFVIFGFLLAAGVIPAVLALRTTQEEGIEPELVRRIQVGLQQGSNLDGEGFDLLELVNGGELLSITSTAEGDHGPNRLQDGLFDPQFNAWRSAGPDFPLTAIYQVRFRTPVRKVIIWNHPQEPPASYIREFEVLASLEDPRTHPDALVSIGRFTAADPDLKLVFDVDTPVPIRYAVVRIYSTFGAADYASAAEIGLFSEDRDPEQAPLPRPPAPLNI
ncbi:MAG: discoidin domain-containing protein [Chloroflexota bacterium]|nr:discoidin domain-containing protein [Chloroflexota bacterium]